MVQPRTLGPFAEPSRIPLDTRDLVRRIPGVVAAGAVTFQIGANDGRRAPLRLFVQGYESGRPGGPPAIAAGHGLTESHYQIVVDASLGAPSRRPDSARTLWRPIRRRRPDPRHGVVGGRRGSLHDAARRTVTAIRRRAGLAATREGRRRSGLETADVNAVLVKIDANASPAAVAQEIDRWKHLSAVTQEQEESYLTAFVIEKMQRQIGLFMVILIVVSAVIISLIVYTLTMDKLRAIATLKLIGAPDRTIVALIVQQALVLGVGGFAVGLALIETFKDRFPRRVLIVPHDVTALFLVVIVVRLLASMLGVRAALRVDPAQALLG